MHPCRRPAERLALALAALALALPRPAAAGFAYAPALDVDAARALLAQSTPISVAVWWEDDPADVGRRYALARGRGEAEPAPREPRSWRGHQQALCTTGAQVVGSGGSWTALRIDDIETLERLLPPLLAPTVAWLDLARFTIVPIAPSGIAEPNLAQAVPAPLPESWDAPAFDCAFARMHREATWLYGDWNGAGAHEVGKYVPASSLFLLDENGNGRWDGPAGGDRRMIFAPGFPGEPIVGDWNGDGRDGVAKQSWFASPSHGTTVLVDANENGVWDGVAGGDRRLVFARWIDQTMLLQPASVQVWSPFVAGDWNGDGADEIGRFVPFARLFLLDANGNGVWDGPAGGDRRMDFPAALTAGYGVAWLPFVGDWNGDGRDGVGQAAMDRALADVDENDRWDGPEVDLDLLLFRPLSCEPVCTSSIPAFCTCW